MVQGIFRYKTNIFKDHGTSALQNYEQDVMYNGPVELIIVLYDNHMIADVPRSQCTKEYSKKIILKAGWKKSFDCTYVFVKHRVIFRRGVVEFVLLCVCLVISVCDGEEDLKLGSIILQLKLVRMMDRVNGKMLG